jgi:predicted O-methyltransferase YrrM
MNNAQFKDYVARLHQTSEAETYANARRQFSGSDEAFQRLARDYASLAPDRKGEFLAAHGISVQDAALSLAVSPEMGEFLYTMTLAKAATRILELGSSNGVSTLYFAEALRVRGGGTVIATELETAKCTALRNNAAAVGLSDLIDLHQGDVFETVKQLQGTFDIVFIDIWASGYLDIFKAIEPLLMPGTIILADNMFTAPPAVQPFKDYLSALPGIQSTTLAFESGVEFAVVL